MGASLTQLKTLNPHATRSLNILKLHKALYLQFHKEPESRGRYPGVSPDTKIILAKGSEGPLEGDLHSAEYFHGRFVEVVFSWLCSEPDRSFSDGLGDIDKRHPELNVDTRDAQAYPTLQFSEKRGVDVAMEVLNSEPPRSVSYIVLGPMTTLAQLVREHGSVVRERIGQVLCMGGSLDVPGNTSAVAECKCCSICPCIFSLIVCTT